MNEQAPDNKLERIRVLYEQTLRETRGLLDSVPRNEQTLYTLEESFRAITKKPGLSEKDAIKQLEELQSRILEALEIRRRMPPDNQH